MHKTVYPRDDIDRLYELRKEGGRGLATTEDSVDASKHGLEDLFRKGKEKLITVTSNTSDNKRTKWTTKTRKQKWQQKNKMNNKN